MEAKFDEDLRGFFKIFCLTIGASAFIIGAMFTFIWKEVKDVNSTVTHIRQIRQPSPSPQLPFKTYGQGERQ